MKFSKVPFFMVCLLLTVQVSLANDFDGYILQKGDTIKGIVDVPVKKYIGGKMEVDFGKMWSQIKFSKKGGKEEKMKAGDIAGFGFIFEGSWYHFEVLDLAANSGTKTPKLLGAFTNNLTFFVCRIVDGTLPVYKQYWNEEKTTTQRSMGTSPNIERVTGYKQNFDLYVKNKDNIFIEMDPEMKSKELKKFLNKYLTVETDFLNTIDENKKFHKVEEVMKAYNEWKMTNNK